MDDSSGSSATGVINCSLCQLLKIGTLENSLKHKSRVPSFREFAMLRLGYKVTVVGSSKRSAPDYLDEITFVWDSSSQGPG